MNKKIKLTVNGESLELEVPAKKLLIDLLRDDLGLTGTKVGCGEGECGACTVLLNGKAVCSCLLLAVEVDGDRITTIEGLVEGGRLHPLQEAFIKEGAAQCGYCTPGMIWRPRPCWMKIRTPLRQKSKWRWPAISAAAPAMRPS